MEHTMTYIWTNKINVVTRTLFAATHRADDEGMAYTLMPKLPIRFKPHPRTKKNDTFYTRTKKKETAEPCPPVRHPCRACTTAQ